jgi:winged helix domain-containing protein
MNARFALQGPDGSRQVLDLAGREEWALSHLIAAGDEGCTPIDTPGPRWSDYVFKLRRRGIDIATITEVHGGPYAGHHARYVLRSKVERLSLLKVAA